MPDIEELTSTLEPGSERRGTDDEDGVPAARESKGFRSGMTVVMLIGAALVALYVLAPLIAHYVPATQGLLTAYVGMIDGLRASIAGMARGVLGG